MTTSSTITSRLPLASSSSVTDTDPSTEFSIGTSAASTAPSRAESSAA